MTNKTYDPTRGTDRQDVQQQHDDLPVRALLHNKRDIVSDLGNKLDDMGWTPDLSGSTIGRRRPLAFSRVYGPIGMQATRNIPGAPGFLGNAPVVQPNTFILPTTNNILTGRNTTFFWTGVHAVSYISWTYTAPIDPAYNGGTNVPVNPLPAGDLFAPVFEKNGGAQLLLNNSGFSFTSADSFLLGQDNPGKPKLCFQLELYDKRRGRLINDGRLPGEMFATGGYGVKELGHAVRVDPDTEIEPRVYITECRMTQLLEQPATVGPPAYPAPYSVASVACWINLVFKGYANTEINT